MTPTELTERAHSYTRQALERLDSLEGKITLTPDEAGAWVSLRRNLESAEADLRNATTPAP